VKPQGICATGQCFTSGENCTSPAPAGPTLSQFTINRFFSLDFFNLTSGEGFNPPVSINPGAGYEFIFTFVTWMIILTLPVM
jgi:hypothetical protein